MAFILAIYVTVFPDRQTLGDIDTLPNQKSVVEHVANTREHFPRFADALGNRLTGSQHQTYERVLASLPKLWERVVRGKNLTLIHGDANFSNVLPQFSIFRLADDVDVLLTISSPVSFNI